jgi:hypothetical protein
MRKLTSILLIFLTFPILQFGQQEEEKRTPKIVLLTFSVNAFDEESKKINTGLKGLKGVIDKELKKSFQIVEELPDEITYSDIELPEVTIDPVVEPETNKKLEQLCKQDWDGLVFGHFHQEDKLIVVSRIYLSKKKYTNLKKDERIISSPEIEIPTTNLDQRSLESHTTQSLQELIKAIKTKRPEVFGLVKKEVKKEPAQKIMEPPKQEPKPKPQDTKPAQVKEQTTIEEDYGVVPLTARDVYQMIIDNGFYCEKVSGSTFHGEAFKTIPLPKNKAFPYNRRVTAVIKGNIIKTRSISREKKTDEKEIVLEWSPEPSECSFQEAKELIDNRNKNKVDKDKKWRIPTIMELFSIVEQGKKKNYFPKGFKLPTDKSFTFWTSTPLKKEGTSLKYDKANKAYLVVQCVFLKGGEYSLRFDFQNLDEKDIKNIYLLPVYSDKVYTYTPILGFDTNSNNAALITGGKDNVPGFDDPPGKNTSKNPVLTPSNKTQKEVVSNKSQDNPQKSGESEKIPGFDYMPNASTVPPKPPKTEPSGSDSQPFKYGTKPARDVNIALFQYISKMTPPVERKLLDDLNNAIKEALKSVEVNLRDNYNPKLKLNIIKMKLSDINDITGFYISLSDTKASDEDKLNNIKRNIMISSNIDIIVTVQHFFEVKNDPIKFHHENPRAGRGMHTFIPVIINGINNKIHTLEGSLQNRDQIIFEYIIIPITRTIIEIIKSEFERKN